MRIVCPTCSAVYEVPDALLSDGKRTRCARCAREWVPQPAAPMAAAPRPASPPPPSVFPAPVIPTPSPPVAPAAAPRAARPSPAPRAEQHHPVKAEPAHSLAVSIALGASILLLAGLCAAAVIWRAVLIGIFPPAERLFLWLGLA